ncbi:MAG: carbohydrate kinase family protein [Blastocatellia bacterium]|nr:carbohydrate kinase family protein [Blastocatellia bacterium]
MCRNTRIFNSKIELTDYYQLAGGEIASTMAGLRRLGMKTAYIGRFGDDSAGDFGLKTLRDDGVNVEFAEQIAGATTQIAFIVIDERNGERTVIWKRDEKLQFKPDEVPLELISRTKVFHATPHDALACVRLAREAKRNGAIISIDIDNLFDGVLEMIPLVDVFISSREFPEKLLGIKDEKTALREIKSRFGCPVVGMTLGEEGSLVLYEDKFIKTKGYAVPNGCKDTTGAGDAFRVGLIYGLLNGENVETTLKMANAVAALKCREIGARTALPNERELLDLIAIVMPQL